MTDNQLILHNQAAYVLRYLSGILPNLERMIAVYYNKEKKSLSALSIEGNKRDISLLEFDEQFDYHGLESLRQSGNKQNWVAEHDLPFVEKTHSSPVQKDVFSEPDNSVLITRSRNPYDRKADLYILFFNRDATNFGPVRNGEILDTSSKNIIENLVYNTIVFAKEMHRDSLDEYEKYRHYLARLRDKLKMNSAELSLSRKEQGKFKLEFANFILNKIRHGGLVNIGFSPEAERVIEAFAGSLKEMELWIREAFDFARFSDFDPHKAMLIIEDWHFGESPGKTELQAPDEEIVEMRYYKTYSLLNRLEQAANKVVASRRKLTGAAVGQAMEQAISAPAISDALKKHRARIISLMEKYPGRWSLIRTEFKPVTNILESKGTKRKMTG